jgi:hypothetical protein
MVDRSNNIDIFFRNGLREYEVLPPPEVWENIRPSLSERAKTRNFLRIAALVSILVSLTAAAVWFTRSISGDIAGLALSMNQEIIPEGFYVSPVQSQRPVTGIPTVPAQNDKPGETAITEPILLDIINPASFSSDMIASGNDENHLVSNLKLIPSNTIRYSVPTNTFSEPLKPEVKSQSSNNWTIAAMASPEYYSSITSGQIATDLAKTEKSILSYSGGMGISYKINKRVSVQSGIIYSSIGQQVTGISSYAGFSKYNSAKGAGAFSVETSSGTIVTTNQNVFLRDDISGRVATQYTSNAFDPVKANLSYVNNSVTQDFNYLEIPVMLRYKAVDRAIDVNFMGGLSYNMLVGNSVFTTINGVKMQVGKTEGLNTFNLSSALGLGLEYNLSGKISLNLEPIFRYYLTPFGNIQGATVHPYSFGVLSGLSYKF